MSGSDSRKKRIVILGGGLGGLTTAFYLSDTSELRQKYDVTVYQLGWRLGGKCASGRNGENNQRIEEHGVHVFSGFYANAFGMLDECYQALNRPPDTPLSTCFHGANPAFEPHNRLSLMENVDKQWRRWDIVFDPDASRVPGTRTHTLWHDLKEVCRKVRDEYNGLSDAQKQELQSSGVSVRSVRSLAKKTLHKVGLARQVDFPELFDSLSDVSHLARPASRSASARNYCGICRTLKELIGFLRAALRFHDGLSDDVRRFSLLANLGLTIVKGVLKHGILQRGFDVIDHYDLRDWLKRHGASPLVIDSAIVRALYAAVFAYQPFGPKKGRPRLAAGVALRVLWRTFFDHKGGFVWKMQAGMGEAVIAPLYQLLKQRGVKFKFFHRVERLELSDDREAIARIHIQRQVTLKGEEYQPLLLPEEDESVDVPAWPSEPRYEQIDDRQADRLRALKAEHLDLESAWLPSEFEQPVPPLVSGDDFDSVVLAIPVGALKPICSDLIAHNHQWMRMVKSLETIQTHSVQLWLNRSVINLGWRETEEEPLVVAYQKPLDSWVGMSQLIEREGWSPADQVRHIGYFVGVAVDQIPLDQQLATPDMPKSQHEFVRQRMQGFLEQDIRPLWPQAIDPLKPSQFDWKLLVDPHGGTGADRLAAQYLRANINPTDRYVLSLPGTTRYRLPSDQSGFENLFLSGDWTRNGLNVGCAEATVMSGMQAARAVSHRKLAVFGEHDPTLPICRSCWPWRKQNRQAPD